MKPIGTETSWIYHANFKDNVASVHHVTEVMRRDRQVLVKVIYNQQFENQIESSTIDLTKDVEFG